MNQLHPGARWIFRFDAYLSLVTIFYLLSFFVVSGVYSGLSGFYSFLEKLLIALAVSLFFLLVLGEIYARMAYSRWKYEITHDSIRIERGIIWKKYTSLPYERVQNVDIRRGILARLFGFSTVEIETAGQSGLIHSGFGRRNRRYTSEGHLPAIDRDGAEKIRAFIMKKIKHSSSEQGI